jgi:hypothetical protein
VTKRKNKHVTARIKELLGFPARAPNAEVLKAWKEASTRVCKPCWELKYCPYGPLVEQFPLLPPLRAEATQHNEYLKRILRQGKFDDGKPIEKERQTIFRGMVADFKPREFPERIPAEITDMECRWFGHICPVVFSAEPFTETTEMRRTGRKVTPSILMRVARRDNYTCQGCGTHLRDDEIEFDHLIPIAKGGSSEEHNLRVTCFSCNRRKSGSVDL